ncbi:flavin reductase, partial [Enterobacter sp. DRP3]|nr:flavin reductase [Enterobacter sp. DRP3]
MHATFERNRQVCINVLPAEHELLARHFAGLTDLPMEQRFQLPVWDRGEQDVPVLRDALASLAAMRYGDSGYVFVMDSKPVVLMHPTLPKLVNT